MMGFFACGDILSFHIGCLFSHCNTLQHTATHCNTLQRTATHCLYSLYSVAVCCNVKIKDMMSPHAKNPPPSRCLHMQRNPCRNPPPSRFDKETVETHGFLCMWRHHVFSHGLSIFTLQHTATHCNTLQHTAGVSNLSFHMG